MDRILISQVKDKIAIYNYKKNGFIHYVLYI